MGPLGGPDAIVNNYMGQMANALGKLEDLVNFVNQVMIHFLYCSLFDKVLFSASSFSVIVGCLFSNSQFQNDLLQLPAWAVSSRVTYTKAKRNFKITTEKMI